MEEINNHQTLNLAYLHLKSIVILAVKNFSLLGQKMKQLSLIQP